MPKTTVRLDAVLIESGRPEELASFYQSAFELGPPSYTSPDHLGFSLENTYLGFDRIPVSPGQSNPRLSIWFKVSDMDATFQRLVSLGATVINPPNGEKSPGEILAFLNDPEGNIIGLISPLPSIKE
jgi:predicted enzyme related to lactoylglutathione lyase